ncbi:MAG: hypothetical protein ACOYMS_03610 [Terrimicrobiaceae bacterium]
MRLERPEGTQATISGNTPVMGRAAAPKKGFSFGKFFESDGLKGSLFRLLRAIISTAILAALLAAIIQMGRKPDGTPAAEAANEAQATKLFQGIKAFADTIYPRALDVSQAQVNNYLAARIVPDAAGESGSILKAKFQRAFVVIGQGEMQFFVEQKFFDWPVFLYLTGEPEAGLDEVSGLASTTFRITGGGIGRMRLDARLVPILQKSLGSVVASASDATDILRRTSAVTLTPGVAKLSWSGSKAPGR